MSNVDICYQNKIIHLSDYGLTASVLSEPFISIKEIFNFDNNDLIVVLRAGIVSNEQIQKRLINQIGSIKNKGRCYFFIEDLFTVEKFELELIDKISKKLNIDPVIFHCEKNNDTEYFDWYVSSYVLSIKDYPVITTDFSKKICCFNRRFTDYRYLASAFLSNYKEDTIVTQHYSLLEIGKSSIDIDKLDARLNLKTGIDFLRLQEKIKNSNDPVNVDYTSPEAITELIKLTQDCFCSLITESKFHSAMPNFSEKTLRAIISGRPFVLLAPVGTLQLLKDLGFKTFSRFWDESYDLEQDSTKRFEKVMFVVKEILEKENLDIEPMMSVLEHNQKQLGSIPKRMYQLLNQRP